MARGIPCPSILEVPDFFSLLDSPRNKFYHSLALRILSKICRGLENTEFPLNMKISESFQKFVDFFLFFSISFWYYYPTLKYKINAEFFFNFFQNLFEFFGCLSGFLMIFWITHSSKFPKDPEE